MKLNLINEREESLIQQNRITSKEYHFFKFESEMKKVQISWKNIFTLASEIGNMEKLDFEPNWTLVDIDNHLKGNPLTLK